MVDAARGRKRVIGPQPDALVTGLPSEAHRRVDERAAESVAARIRVDEQDSQLGGSGLVGRDTEDAADAASVELRDPGRVAIVAGSARVVGNDPRDPPLELVSQPYSRAYSSPCAITTQPRSPGLPRGLIRQPGAMSKVESIARITETVVSVAYRIEDDRCTGRGRRPTELGRREQLLERAYDHVLLNGIAAYRCARWPRRSARARVCCCSCSAARINSCARCWRAHAPTRSRCSGRSRGRATSRPPRCRCGAGWPPTSTAGCCACGLRATPGRWSSLPDRGAGSRARQSTSGSTARASPAPEPTRTTAGEAERTFVLALLRGALLDLIATEDKRRTTRAVEFGLAAAEPQSREEARLGRNPR